MKLQEQISRIHSMMGVITESSDEVTLLPMENLRRPNGAIGTQGFTTESLINLIKHISKVKEFNLPEYNSAKELIMSLKENPEVKHKIISYVKQDPVVIIKLPDDSYKIKDGNHRANLLNLLDVSYVPSIIKE
jgi:hypothetical protein